jgi:hypothetical protein
MEGTATEVSQLQRRERMRIHLAVEREQPAGEQAEQKD